MSVTKDPLQRGNARGPKFGPTAAELRKIAAMLDEKNVPHSVRGTFRFFDPDDIPTDGQYWVDLSA